MSHSHLRRFEPIVDFLADFLGSDTEVVLHDLSQLEQSIYKIRHGHISGRQVGDPITDLVVKTLKSDSNDMDYQCNYVGKSINNKKLKCATYYIRDDAGVIVGALCINMLVDDFLQAKAFIDKFLNGFAHNLNAKEPLIEENLGMTIPDMVDSKVAEVVASIGVDKNALQQSDKMDIIYRLNEEGVFLLKGTVSKIAHELDMSEPTIYKYLKKAKSTES